MTTTSCQKARAPASGKGHQPAQDLAEVFDRCARGLYRYLVVRLGHDTHLADDMMQQVWLQARTATTDVPAEALEFYLRRIATNLVRAHWRREGRRRAHVPVANPAVAAELAEQLVTRRLPADMLEQREVSDQLLLAITALSDADQTLIIGHYFQGLSHASLARMLGVTERAVEGRMYRARQALRDTLRGHDEICEVTP